MNFIMFIVLHSKLTLMLTSVAAVNKVTFDSICVYVDVIILVLYNIPMARFRLIWHTDANRSLGNMKNKINTCTTI